jgi:hypothetical protein
MTDSAAWTIQTGRPFNDDGLEIFAILDADQAIVDKAEDKEILEEGAPLPLTAQASVGNGNCQLPL